MQMIMEMVMMEMVMMMMMADVMERTMMMIRKKENNPENVKMI